MTERLIFLLGLSPEAPFRWAHYSDDRLIEGGWLESAADLPALRERFGEIDLVAALLPGEQAATRRMTSVPKGAAKARAAALYLMEDELGESAEALHVAASDSLAFAVKTAILEEWRSLFAAAGFDLDILSADYLVMPSSDDVGVIVFDEGRVVAAINGGGFAVDNDLFDMLGAELLKDGPPRLQALGDITLLRRLPETITVERLGALEDARLLDLYAVSLSEAATPNFLQGPYQKRRTLMPALLPWRRAGALAAALAALFVVSLVATGLRSQSEAKTWNEAAQKVHTERFPDAASENPTAHARKLLAQQGGDVSFLVLASRFADAMEKNDTVQIDRIRYNASRNEFVVSVKSQTNSGIEDLKNALAAAGVATQDSGGYRRSGAYWTGDLMARTQ